MTDKTTATERLRALLDKRGVKYREWDGTHPITVWHDGQFTYEYMERSLADGVKPHTGEVLDGTGRLEAVIHVCSPEQAVEATLGRGTCMDKCSRFNAWVCSECGATVLLMFDDYGEPSYSVDGVADVPHYCPSCGRRVVE